MLELIPIEETATENEEFIKVPLCAEKLLRPLIFTNAWATILRGYAISLLDVAFVLNLTIHAKPLKFASP